MRKIPDYPLWLGHAGDARDAHAILTAEIVAVVDLAAEEPSVALPREILCLRFPLLDGEGNPPWLLTMAIDTVAELIRSEWYTLVACGAGMSRSPVIAAAAICQLRTCPLKVALSLVSQSTAIDISPRLLGDVHAVLRRTG